MPHLIANAFLWGIGEESKEFPRLGGSSFRDFIRVAGSSPEMWLDIFLTNRENLIKAVSTFKEKLELIADYLESGEEEELFDLLNKLKAWRKELF
ncbi:MAG: hypothetical protein PWP04_552 [Candidatus Atribacteria bacterium]|nr:hypothetical protein [Candidatus Atribacteria bacterium]